MTFIQTFAKISSLVQHLLGVPHSHTSIHMQNDTTMRDLRFSWQWSFKSWSSSLWQVSHITH